MHDWHAHHRPPVAVCHGAACVVLAELGPLPEFLFGLESGFFTDKNGVLFFVLPVRRVPDLDPEQDAVYVAGDFNGWQDAVGQEHWQLKPGEFNGLPVLLWSGEAKQFSAGQRFKFVTGWHHWLPVPDTAPNALRDDLGNANHQLDPNRSGRHLFSFSVAEPLDLTQTWTVGWADDGGEVPLRPGAFFHALETELPLGAVVGRGDTTFRLFAPRAQRVELCLCSDLGGQGAPLRYALRHQDEADGRWAGTWEVTLEQNLHGWFYWYSVAGPEGPYSHFDPSHRVLDPYALATVDRDGPGIVLDRKWIGLGDRSFRTPPWQDLVIAEAHVRDLVVKAPLESMSDAGVRLGFRELQEWVESPEFHLHRLGINAVELQPVQEFDDRAREEYHWGYMTNNYFSVESSYASKPAEASGIREFQDLVAAFHRRGMAVILDVVYNHVGEPAHLLFVDKLYYFEMNDTGRLSNWSGCGNDLRASSAMTRRLVIDSLIHLVEAYGVDGFRFDLAELLGVELLSEVERELKRVKPDIILIAEPWSFRGHIAGELRDTGFASWNDGYREFLREFVRGGATPVQFEYFLKGSPWHFAKWPAQTVNYAASHDDRAWIDVITENPDFQGDVPTANDRRRTHIMAAILFASIGIPMLPAGQDFMRSKRGVSNTYQRGDLNALDYTRVLRYPGTHGYFADWIAFRRSEAGRLLRHYSRASEGFFRFYFAPDSTAAAVVYNADRSMGGKRLMFMVNPTAHDATIALDAEAESGPWRQLANIDRFLAGDAPGMMHAVKKELFCPALSLGLWIAE